MIPQSTTSFLIGHLVGALEADVAGSDLTNEDAQLQKIKEARLCDICERIVYRSGTRYFLMSESGVLWVFNGRWYERITGQAYLKVLIKRAMERLGVGLIYQMYTASKIEAECLQGMENEPGCVFRPNRRYIVFDNGVFDVKSGRLDPDFGTGYNTDLVMGIPYDPGARHLLWEQKLEEIIPNEGMREALQMFCGMLVGDRDETKFEYACFIQGPGSNGKSVIASAIANAFGQEHFGKFEPKQLLKASNSEFAMAALDGMIANFTDDLSKDDVSGGMFKKFVSGEEFPARHPYGHTFFKVKAPMLLCCCNEMPSTTDDTWGYHRRILPIVSTDRILNTKEDGRDTNLTAKLATPEARMAVFNWIYEGYRKVMANGGDIPLASAVVERQLELRDDSNSARRWIRDAGLAQVEPSKRDDRWKNLSDWHKDYRQYCEDMGDRYPQTAKSLAKLFREKGFASRLCHGCTQFCIGSDGGWEDSDAGAAAGSGSAGDPELPF